MCQHSPLPVCVLLHVLQGADTACCLDFLPPASSDQAAAQDLLLASDKLTGFQSLWTERVPRLHFPKSACT